MKNKKKPVSYILNAFFWIALIIIILFKDVRTEVFGFIQRGVIEIGLVNPDVDKHKTSAGKKTYELTLQNSEGKTIQLSNIKDKVVFINFWATWCPPCVAEMPSINQLHEKYKDDNEVIFLLISKDQNFEKAKNFIKRKKFDFDVFKIKSEIPQEFDSNTLPTTYLLDKNGNIVFTHKGMANYNSDDFINFIDKLKNGL